MRKNKRRQPRKRARSLLYSITPSKTLCSSKISRNYLRLRKWKNKRKVKKALFQLICSALTRRVMLVYLESPKTVNLKMSANWITRAQFLKIRSTVICFWNRVVEISSLIRAQDCSRTLRRSIRRKKSSSWPSNIKSLI